MRLIMHISLPPEKFNATVEFLPAMTSEDLQKSGLDELAKRWG
jgi:hypothetical protein